MVIELVDISMIFMDVSQASTSLPVGNILIISMESWFAELVSKCRRKFQFMQAKKCWGLAVVPWSIWILFFSSCTQFQRSPESGYGETALVQLQEHSSERFSFSEVSKKNQVRRLENTLSSQKELEQYSKALPWFESDDEKLAFLKLDNFEAKQAWLAERRFAERSQAQNAQYQKLISTQDIAIGMPHNFVRQSWGPPASVQVSGNPQMKNERWIYTKSISGPDGARFEKRIVYFEGGRVSGWETE